jgi:hypothetical protein
MLRLVFSSMLNYAPYLRKQELSSLFRMSMVSMCNEKECQKGMLERRIKIYSFYVSLATNNQLALM